MKIAPRVASLKSSPTIALNSRVQQLARDGHDIVNLTVGEPDYPTPRPIVERAIASLNQQRTKYGPAGGGLGLRQAIAEKLQQENHLAFSADEVVVGCGAKEILCHLFLSLVAPGDEVLLPCPFWVSYEDQIKLAEGRPVLIPPAFDQERNLILEPEMLEKWATDKTVALVLCSPSNPSGSVLSRAALLRLGAYLKTKNWWIISDEIYEYFSYEQRHNSLLQLCPELKDRFILVNGLSKSFAMTGWRVGYAAGPQRVISTVKTLQSHSSTCLPPFIEDAAEWAVAQGAELMRHEIASMQARRDLAVTLARPLADFNFVPPRGAFYLFVDIRQILAKSPQYANLSSLAFCEGLLEQQKVAVVPGEAFGAPGYLRISYACDEQKLREGFRRIALYLQGFCRS
jgi:aspartate aminotransferase